MARIIFVPDWLDAYLTTDAVIEKFVNDPLSITELTSEVKYYHKSQLAFCRFLISDVKTNDIMLDVLKCEPDVAFDELMYHNAFDDPEYALCKKRVWQEPIMWSEFVNGANSADDVQFILKPSRDGKLLFVTAKKKYGTVSESYVTASVGSVLDEGLKKLHGGFRIQRSTPDTGEVFRENPILASLYLSKSF